MNIYLKTASFCLALIIFISCAQAPAKNEAANDVPSQTSDTTIVASPLPFTTIDAESLIGKYYNQQNQDAKYARYKTVATNSVHIDSSYHKDTILLTINSIGRKWNNPNRDTITTPFSEDVMLKVYRYRQIWWADKLQPPDAVNSISEPVKK